MEKLIDLLNQSEDGFVSKFISYDGINGVFRLDNGQSFHYTLILSKEYRFIQRLVDNDKIDKEKVWKNESPDIFDYSFYEVVLMLLSIQDNPIEFLIGILK